MRKKSLVIDDERPEIEIGEDAFSLDGWPQVFKGSKLKRPRKKLTLKEVDKVLKSIGIK